MQEITVSTYPADKSEIIDILSSKGIYINEYARTFLSHPGIASVDTPAQITLVICSLSELGFPDGAVFEDIGLRIQNYGLSPCKPLTGVYFRLAYLNQSKSRDSILNGYHSPEGAIVVFSELLENDVSFPKGLYLRNIDGNLWLRGYVCDNDYVWSGDDIFAFLKI